MFPKELDGRGALKQHGSHLVIIMADAILRRWLQRLLDLNLATYASGLAIMVHKISSLIFTPCSPVQCQPRSPRKETT